MKDMVMSSMLMVFMADIEWGEGAIQTDHSTGYGYKEDRTVNCKTSVWGGTQ